MLKENRKLNRKTYRHIKFEPYNIMGAIEEVVFHNPAVSVGIMLILLGLLLPFAMVIDLVHTSLEMLFLWLSIIATGMAFCLAGICSIHNDR